MICSIFLPVGSRFQIRKKSRIEKTPPRKIGIFAKICTFAMLATIKKSMFPKILRLEKEKNFRLRRAISRTCHCLSRYPSTILCYEKTSSILFTCYVMSTQMVSVEDLAHPHRAQCLIRFPLGRWLWNTVNTIPNTVFRNADGGPGPLLLAATDVPDHRISEKLTGKPSPKNGPIAQGHTLFVTADRQHQCNCY